MAEKATPQFSWKIAGALVWLVFTLTMAGWWLYLGLRLLDQLNAQPGSLQDAILRQRNMLLWEGLAWMVLLVGGGATLVYLIGKERKSAQALRGFLASFSHDVKTALTSIQLQAEIIAEEAGNLPAVKRLESDVVRLQLQLENSLFLASEENIQFFIESVSLKQTLENLVDRWPGLSVEVGGEALLRVDRRALESVISNILQNSVVHGRAKKVIIEVKRKGAETVEVLFRDDGKGFRGKTRALGELFDRHNPSSGSGVGLYTVAQLIRSMGGEVGFQAPEEGGFEVDLLFKGSMP